MDEVCTKEMCSDSCCAEVNKDAQIYSLQEQIEWMNKDISDYITKINFLQDLFAEARGKMHDNMRDNEIYRRQIYKYRQACDELHMRISSMPNNKYRKELLNIFNKFNI